MNKGNVMVGSIFTAVVVLLAIGAVGEVFSSLFSKAKSLSDERESTNETEKEVATQLK